MEVVLLNRPQCPLLFESKLECHKGLIKQMLNGWNTESEWDGILRNAKWHPFIPVLILEKVSQG
jgi:hypothetical protein